MSPLWVNTENQLRLAIVPRPRGNDWLQDDFARLKLDGVDVLVSMLPSDEAADLGLAEERSACKTVGIAFESFQYPIAKRQKM